MAVDTMGNLLTLNDTPADEQDRAQVATLAEAVQQVTGESVELASVDQGYTGDDADVDEASYGIHLDVISLPEAKKGFVLLPSVGGWSVQPLVEPLKGCTLSPSAC